MHPGRSQEGCATIPRVARPRKDPVYAKNRALMRFGAKAIGLASTAITAPRAPSWLDCQVTRIWCSISEFSSQSRKCRPLRRAAAVAEPVKRAYGEPIAIGYGRKAQ